MTKPVKRLYKWITLMPDDSPAWFNEDNTPVLWDSEKEATIHMTEDHIHTLEIQVQELKDGHREPDEIDLECEERVVACILLEDGCIEAENKVIFNPKTFAR